MSIKVPVMLLGLTAVCGGIPSSTRAATRAELVLQMGHTDKIHSVAWSPDSKRLATAAEDGTAMVWDAQSGEKIHTLQGEAGLVFNGIRSVAWSPDGKRLATGGWDRAPIIWDAQSGEKILSLKGNVDVVFSVAWSPDGKRLAMGTSRIAVVWDALSGEELLSLKGHRGWVNSVSWSPDGKRLATASDDETVLLWDAQTGNKLLSLKGHRGWVKCVAWSPDGKHLATGAYGDGTVIVWDARSGEKIRSFKGSELEEESVSWSPDGKRLAALSERGQAVVWDAQSGDKVLTLGSHTHWIHSVVWSPDGKRLASASYGGTAVVRDAQSGEEVLFLRGNTNPVNSVAWRPDGRRVAMGSADGTAVVWDAERGEQVLSRKGDGSNVSSVAWSPAGKHLATGLLNTTAVVWDAQSGNKVLTLKGHSGTVTSVSWSPDGKRLATASQDNTAQVWDAQTGEKVLTLKGHKDLVVGVSWSSDGKRLATASQDNTAQVWDAQTGEKLLTLQGHSSYLTSVAWSLDGKRLATASLDSTAVVWDAQSGGKIHCFKGHKGKIDSVSWSPDGRRLATASHDKTAGVWDTQGGKKLLSITGHLASVTSISWAPDGKCLATGSEDRTMAVWNAESGQLLWQSLALGSDWISFTPQGYYHGTLGAEGIIRWRLTAEKGEWPRLVGPSQFRDTFYRPDLFRHLLASGDVAAALAAADSERGTSTTFTNVGRKQPPLVVITTPKHRARVGQAEVRVEAIAVSAGDDPVTSLQLEVNGQPEGRILRVQQPRPGQVPGEWPRAPLRPGENTLRVLARAGGSLGYSAPIKVTYDTREQIKVRLHLLIIGVSKYKVAPDAGGYRSLRHAAADAGRIRDVFVQYGRGLYDDIPEPIVLLDAEATRERIQDAVQSFSERMGKDDMGVIFFAGHGDRYNDRLYLAAHDTRKDRLPATGISAAQLRDMLAAAKGRKYLFLDACHAGGVLQRSSGDSIHEDIIRELRREAAGLVIATACRGSQKANEEETLGGYFAAALVEGLSGKGSYPNGVVRVKYLKLYVEERLKELTKALNADHQQEPLFDGPDELMDLPLARAKR